MHRALRQAVCELMPLYEIAMRKLTTAELVARKPAPEEFRKLPRHPIYVVCDNVRSLENVGLIFRLCDATLVQKLFLCGITGYPRVPEGDTRRPQVIERAERAINKTAIQTVQWVPWEYRESAVEVVRELREQGVQIVALEQTDVSLDYLEAPYHFPLCIILGHEREGVEDAVLAMVDFAVQIPMYGMGNSLNVAMAFGIAAYELLHCCLRPKKVSAPPSPLGARR